MRSKDDPGDNRQKKMWNILKKRKNWNENTNRACVFSPVPTMDVVEYKSSIWRSLQTHTTNRFVHPQPYSYTMCVSVSVSLVLLCTETDAHTTISGNRARTHTHIPTTNVHICAVGNSGSLQRAKYDTTNIVCFSTFTWNRATPKCHLFGFWTLWIRRVFTSRAYFRLHD